MSGENPRDNSIAAIRRRWSRDGGMGNDRSDEDYTDEGCRLLLRVAWDDIDVLLAGLAVPTTGEQEQ